MRARIVAIGQRAAGDDAVGLVVLDRLRREKEHAELFEAADATALIPLLRYRGPLILIDACVGPEPPGVVRELPVESMAVGSPSPVSSHALSVRQAINLAWTLYPDEVSRLLHVVGISIAPPEARGAGLSQPVAEAVPRAVDAIAGILGRCGEGEQWPTGRWGA